MDYKHTQIGYFLIFIMIIISTLFAFILFKSHFEFLITILIIAITLILISFITLTVSIDETYLRLRFGYGLFHKKFRLKDIKTVKTVKNHWYYGYGIRVWLWPYMVIFNVSGFDAVEIQTKNNKIYRIGTDEPEKLKKAIEQNIISS